MPPGWKLDGAALHAALTATIAAQESLNDIFTEQDGNDMFAGLAWGGGLTSCVGAALSQVLQEQQTVNLKTVANHIVAGIAGVGNAARQVQAGDEAMASNFQREMFEAASDGDFSYFEEHGYRSE